MTTKTKISTIIGLLATTVAIHYGWVLEPLFGDSHWIHAIHGRFCYIPIVVAASWFGIRGGVITATAISILVIPYILMPGISEHYLAGEIVEIFFYFAIALLTGAIIEKELLQRKKKEEAQLQLERAHRLSMIGQMAASVAHEIKNPLTSIKGAVEIISDKTTGDSDKKEFQSIIFNEIKRLDGTINEFLQFARPKKIELKPVNFSDLIQTTVKQLDPQLNKCNITVNYENNEQIIIHADKEQIQQVILNLLLNAMHASSNNSSINLSLTPNKTIAVFTIQDFGEGISDDHLNKIFDPFFTTKTSGTGLGLAVVKAIVENHEGTIDVSSTVNRGTTFTITLPIYEEPVHD